MLELLHIENIAVIESADISFRPGFNALTGETGAGKSIVIDSISAVLGQRTSRDLIRTGANMAFVSACFTDIPPRLGEDLGIAWEGELLLQREIHGDGKNVCRVNGRPVTVTQLRTLGSRLLKRGSKGDDVSHLQSILVEEMGYDLGTYGAKGDGVDGNFGEKTEKAVKRFQSFAQIEVDGKYGSITHKALMGVLDDIAKGENGSDGDDTPDTPSSKYIYVTGSSVNVRSGPATTYKVLTRVNKGDTMPYIATAEALGWHAVEIGGKIGWISGKYSSVEEG